jgi:type VI secretion system protein VasI
MLGLFGVAEVHAQADPSQAPARDPRACAAVADNAQRLACYDAIFRVASPPTALAPIVIASTQPIPARPTGRAPAAMTISCADEVLGVSFSFAGQLLSETGDEAAISFQVQQTGSFVRSLPVSDDNTTIGFASASDADAFLETLEGGDSLVVRITPVRQRSVQVEFPLDPYEAAIASMRAACTR